MTLQQATCKQLERAQRCWWRTGLCAEASICLKRGFKFGLRRLTRPHFAAQTFRTVPGPAMVVANQAAALSITVMPLSSAQSMKASIASAV